MGRLQNVKTFVRRLAKGARWGLGCLAVLFATGYLLTWGDYSVAETVAQNPKLPHVTLNGVTFHAETFGREDAPTVIVIHGGPGGDYRYLLSLKELADEYFVVFYDQRGTGLSPRVNPKDITVEATLDDLDAIAEHYAPGEQVYLLGHSWGAMVATGYLARRPEKVAKAVIAEPGAFTHEDLDAFFRATAPRPSLELAFKVVRGFFETLHMNNPGPQARWDYFAVRASSSESHGGYYCGGKRSGYSFPYWRWGVLAAQNLVRSGRDASGRFQGELLTDGLENYTDKVLLIASECNQLTGRTLQEKQLTFFPNADLAVIPNTGHEMFTEDPAASIPVVRAYFAE